MPTPPSRRWYQIELKDVAIGAALIALGFCGIALMMSGAMPFNAHLPKKVESGLTIAIALGMYALVGAGFGAPFKRKLLGALVALFAIGSVMLATIF